MLLGRRVEGYAQRFVATARHFVLLIPHGATLVAAHKYPQAGRCIYCDDPPIGEEHIIPRNIGGRLILPMASCKACEKTVGLFEDRCAKSFFGIPRAHLGIKGRKSKRPAQSVHADVIGGGSLRIPISEHPGWIFYYLFWPPRILLGLPNHDDYRTIAGRITASAMTLDVVDRQKRLGTPIIAGRNLDAMMLAKQIAKIAHAFVCAEAIELAIPSFKPYLIPIILGEVDAFPAYFIGGLLSEQGERPELRPRSTERHEISWHTETSATGANLAVVSMRLFADLDTPTYCAVAGELDVSISRPKQS